MEGFPWEISGLIVMRSRSFWVFIGGIVSGFVVLPADQVGEAGHGPHGRRNSLETRIG